MISSFVGKGQNLGLKTARRLRNQRTCIQDALSPPSDGRFVPKSSTKRPVIEAKVCPWSTMRRPRGNLLLKFHPRAGRQQANQFRRLLKLCQARKMVIEYAKGFRRRVSCCQGRCNPLRNLEFIKGKVPSEETVRCVRFRTPSEELGSRLQLLSIVILRDGG